MYHSYITGDENDCQMDGIAKMAPVVAFYAGKPEMLEKVEAAVRVTQNNDACVAETLAAARRAGFTLSAQPHTCHSSFMGILKQLKSLLNFRRTNMLKNCLWMLFPDSWSISS